MKKTAIILMLITVFSKILGFIREVTLSYFYGASNISDAFLISLTIPTVIFSLIGRAISTGYIPMYSNIEKEYGEKEGTRYTSNLVTIVVILCTIIVIVGLIFTEQIVRLFAKGFEGETLKLAIKFTQISLVGIYFTAIVSIFSGFLQLKGNYVIPASIGLPTNLLITLFILLSFKTDTIVLSIGGLIATASQLILLIPFIRKEGYRYNFILDIKNKHIKNMIHIVIPVMIGASVNQINVLIDRTLASSIIVGGISALNYADKLNNFVQGLFVLPISTVMYPMISKMAAEDDLKGFKKSVAEGINSINLLVIPATVGTMIFTEEIVKLLFGRGAFDFAAIDLTSNALFFYAIGMIGYGLRELLAKSFYSLQDTTTTMVNGTIGVIINIILNFILSKYMGIGGLALATSISAIFCTVLLFISFRKKIGSFGMKRIITSSVKILCASLTMGIISKISYGILFKHINANVSLIIAVLIGTVTYFVLIYFMGIEEVCTMIRAIKDKLNRNVKNE